MSTVTNIKKNKILFMIGITSDWSFVAATILFGLKKYRKIPYDIVVLHDGLDEKQKSLLSSIVPCRFEYFEINLPKTDKFNRLSSMTFSRFEVFKFIKDYQYVVWLDADALIVGNLDYIENTCVDDISMFLHKNTPIKVSFSSNVEGFDMERECFNAGIFVLKNTIKNPDIIYPWLFNTTFKYIDFINSDQAVINMMLQKFDIRVSEMDIIYNFHPEKLYLFTKPKILHPWGNRKFWNYYYNKKWNNYYAKWVSIGGERNISYEKFRLQQIFMVRFKKKIIAILSILRKFV